MIVIFQRSTTLNQNKRKQISKPKNNKENTYIGWQFRTKTKRLFNSFSNNSKAYCDICYRIYTQAKFLTSQNVSKRKKLYKDKKYGI